MSLAVKSQPKGTLNMKTIRILVTFMFMFLLGCAKDSNRPSILDVQNHFYENQKHYEDLSEVACYLGGKKQKFSYTINKFTYSTSKVNDEDRIPELDELLKNVGTEAISYLKTDNDKCQLYVQHFAIGFAGTGMKYGFFFQKQNEMFVKDIHEAEELVLVNGRRIEFDLKLTNSWSLHYRKTD